MWQGQGDKLWTGSSADVLSPRWRFCCLSRVWSSARQWWPFGQYSAPSPSTNCHSKVRHGTVLHAARLIWDTGLHHSPTFLTIRETQLSFLICESNMTRGFCLALVYVQEPCKVLFSWFRGINRVCSYDVIVADDTAFAHTCVGHFAVHVCVMLTPVWVHHNGGWCIHPTPKDENCEARGHSWIPMVWLCWHTLIAWKIVTTQRLQVRKYNAEIKSNETPTMRVDYLSDLTYTLRTKQEMEKWQALRKMGEKWKVYTVRSVTNNFNSKLLGEAAFLFTTVYVGQDWHL